MLKIKNTKLLGLLKDKDELVKEGRGISVEIEKLEAQMKIYEDKEKAITLKVEPKELGEKVEALKKEINDKIKEFEKVSKEIVDLKLAAIPEKMEKEHKELMANKEKLERDRNKIALKVQKIKDRAVPIIQKEVKPFLQEYEDIETADVKDGGVVVNTFSHLENWKEAWKKRNS